MFSFFRSSVVPDEYSVEQLETYSRLRLQVLLGAFLCYSAYYLVRKNIVMAMPDLVAQGFSKSDLGLAMSALTVSYGISNFMMGYLSDRIDTRKLMPLCLVGSALISLIMGFAPIVQIPLLGLSVMMALNGFLQGAGWPSSAKLIAHWFHSKERGRAMSFWNLSHNVGCGLLGPMAILAVVVFTDWQSKFYLPAFIALAIAFVSYHLLRDKPTDCGLPAPFPEHCIDAEINREKTSFSSTLRLFCNHCLKIPALWLLVLANACVYFVRYGVIDWAPLYLTEVRGFSFEAASWAFFGFEYAAIAGTLFCGYLSDRHFRGRRAPVNVLFLSLVTISLISYWQSPQGETWYAILPLISMGFLIYGPLMLIHVHIIDVVPLPFAGTAAGFCGLFGYLFGATSANLLLGKVMDIYGWDACFQLLMATSLFALGLMLLLWLWENFNPHPDLNFMRTEAQPAVVTVRSKNNCRKQRGNWFLLRKGR